jgi:hypothetical protein
MITRPQTQLMTVIVPVFARQRLDVVHKTHMIESIGPVRGPVLPAT